MVHGIGRHLPGYSARLTKYLMRALGLEVTSERAKEFVLQSSASSDQPHRGREEADRVRRLLGVRVPPHRVEQLHEGVFPQPRLRPVDLPRLIAHLNHGLGVRIILLDDPGRLGLLRRFHQRALRLLCADPPTADPRGRHRRGDAQPVDYIFGLSGNAVLHILAAWRTSAFTAA